MSGIDLHPLDVLKLGFWNINGLNSKVIGNKLTNQDFSQKIEPLKKIQHLITLQDLIMIIDYESFQIFISESHLLFFAAIF